MEEDLGKQRSWQRGLGSGMSITHSRTRKKVGVAGLEGVTRSVTDEIGEARARGGGFCHAAEILFIPPRGSYGCWTFTSPTVTSYIRPASAVSPLCELSHSMPTIGLGRLILKATFLFILFYY